MSRPNWNLVNRAQPINPRKSLNVGLDAWFMVVPWLYKRAQWIDLVRNVKGTNVNFTSAVGWNSSHPPGGFGSMHYNGTNAYTLSNYTNLGNLPDGTVVLWLLPTTPLNEGVTRIWFSASTSGGSNQFRINKGVGANVRGGWLISGVSYDVLLAGATASAAYQQGVWQCYGVTWHRVNGTVFYYNGVPVGSLSTPPGPFPVVGSPAYNTVPQAIGAQNQSNVAGGFASDYLDDIRVYTRALAASEMSALYEEKMAGYPTLFNYRRYGLFSLESEFLGQTPPGCPYRPTRTTDPPPSLPLRPQECV